MSWRRATADRSVARRGLPVPVGGRAVVAGRDVEHAPDMFWMRDRRAERRKKVLDELMDLDPAERRARLDAAVAAGDVRESEVESALLLAHRLDVLRVMTVPSSGRLPGGVMPIKEYRLGERAAAAADAAAVPIVDETEAEAGVFGVSGVGWERVSRTAHSGAHSSRRRRMRAGASGRTTTAPRRARAASSR
jgi:hypothetical protein